MPLTAGQRLGPYEIVSPLGAGGMGEVYRARDTRLGRDVAVKVLPAHLSTQPEIRARFEREARTVSSLNHTNICVLYDVGQTSAGAPGGAPGGAGSGSGSGNVEYLVMELVEGETLTERLKRGALPAAELLRFGVQIADAIDRAHRAGVIHRDLKPGNVMVTRTGVKLMDFGLSRVTGMAASGSGSAPAALTQSPTIAQALTAEGTLLGTFQYMSPEQLEGKEADARSDIWALGCVLYEMATGRRAFEGRSQASLIAAILERDPPAVGEVPSGSVAGAPGAPPHGMERLIRNCLAKDPEERIQTAHDVKLQLQAIAEGLGVPATSVVSAPALAGGALAAPRRAGGSRFAWSVAIVAALVALAAVGWAIGRRPAPPPVARFQVGPLPGATDVYWPRLSPDGRYLLVLGTDSTGSAHPYLRPIDQIEAHVIPGPDNIARAYWSPDSREIAFVAGGKLERLALAGGSPVEICPAIGGADLSWGSKGLILMDGNTTDSLRVVAASGGELRPAARIDHRAGEIGNAWPCFLPDGERFLFIGNVSGENRGGDIRLGRIGSLDSKRIGHSDGRVEWAPGGWALFLRGSSLVAQKLDVGAGRLTGEPITLADGIRTGGGNGHFSVSPSGLLAFVSAAGASRFAIREAKRDGTLLGSPLVTGTVASPEISPDGKRLLYLRSSSPDVVFDDVYVLDLERSTDTRLTFTGDRAFAPRWAPDGRRFGYEVRAGRDTATIYVGPADGLGAQDSTRIVGRAQANLSQWSAASPGMALYDSRGHGFSVAIDSRDRAPRVLGDSSQVVGEPQVSPDGRWLACVMGDVPNLQIFVHSLGGPPGRWQISTRSGIYPRWTKGGRELVWEGWDGRLMAVDIDTKQGFHPGTPHPLFPLPIQSFSEVRTTWCCDASGERFFVTTGATGAAAPAVEVVTDLRALLSHR